MEDEPYDDHEGEKDIEREGDGEIWIIEAEGNLAPVATIRFSHLVVDEHDTHSWISDVSEECHCEIAEVLNTYLNRRGT